MSKQSTKRKPGRPVAGLNRRPRNVQMTDEAYARLVALGNGRAADGIDRLLLILRATQISMRE